MWYGGEDREARARLPDHAVGEACADGIVGLLEGALDLDSALLAQGGPLQEARLLELQAEVGDRSVARAALVDVVDVGDEGPAGLGVGGQLAVPPRKLRWVQSPMSSASSWIWSNHRPTPSLSVRNGASRTVTTTGTWPRRRRCADLTLTVANTPIAKIRRCGLLQRVVAVGAPPGWPDGPAPRRHRRDGPPGRPSLDGADWITQPRVHEERQRRQVGLHVDQRLRVHGRLGVAARATARPSRPWPSPNRARERRADREWHLRARGRPSASGGALQATHLEAAPHGSRTLVDLNLQRPHLGLRARRLHGPPPGSSPAGNVEADDSFRIGLPATGSK